ncbi:MAG: twin-arginine translocase subunit TatC [Gemmatimonadales bacterium]
MDNPAGEMPFLDHLEELRGRIIRALIAVFIGVGIGLWVVTTYNAIGYLKAPIAPYLPGGKLTILAPTEQVMVILKLGVVLGLVLASPVIIYQLWAFLSPALYDREKKAMIPALGLGLLLFLFGSWLGWIYGVPLSLKFLLTVSNDFVNQITFAEYFSFVIQVILAVGISFELPLIMTLLSWVGVMDAKRFSGFRRYAVLLNCIAGAILSPGTDVLSMIVCSALLIALYELGVLGAFVVQRRRRKAAQIAGAMVLFAMLAGGPKELHAQNPPFRPPGADTGRARVTPGVGARAIDSSTAKRLGIPTKPKYKFLEPDSVMQALLKREGFAVTRFRGDSATLLPGDEGLFLGGHAATVRDTSVLEANEIIYSDARCELSAKGEPRMFEDPQGRGKILVGRTMKFDTCHERGVIGEATTTFDDAGANWFLRGNLAVDSTGKRLYAAHSEFTSCDLAEPHYHFQSGQVKWVSQSVLVARPAVLYIRDVPIVWMPFLFQDTKVGRRSGILIPNFGFNDIVRPSRSYNRQVTNIGYYWAPNDYIDLTAHMDWYANRYMRYGSQFRYRWRDRFVTGDFAIDKEQQSQGGGSTNIRWSHDQQFNNATSLRIGLNYVGNSTVLQNNTVDPLLSTQNINSSLNLTKRFSWGQATLGATRRQTLSDGQVQMTLPSLNITPRPFEFGQHVSWSPNLSLSNDLEQKTPFADFLAGNGRIDSVAGLGHKRTTNITLGTPIRIGTFNWSNTLTASDFQASQRRTVTQRLPDLSTADPLDSISVSTVRNGDFLSTFDWNTGINLPLLLQGTFKVTPTLGITNVTSGALMVRNTATNGQWVQQGKKLQLSLASTPYLFGFLGGFGPVQRFRASINPVMNLQYSPKARLSEEYARAVSGGGGISLPLETPPTLTASVSLNQTYEAKMRAAPGDTNTDDTNRRKLAILNWGTSPIAYDFEQAKLPGRTGWTTAAVTNTLQSALVRGLQVSLTHDLWEGQVGTDTAKFAPFLSNANASMALDGGTFRSIASFLGLAKKRDPRDVRDTTPVAPSYMSQASRRFRPGAFSNTDAYATGAGRGFTANLNYSLQRRRPTGTTVGSVSTDPNDIFFPPTNLVSGNHSNLGLSTSFSPTRYWSVSWSTQYNITDSKFESQVIRLQRDLHDWMASFDFSKTATGNFAFFFTVTLKPLPDVKFDYNQTTLQPR